MGEDDANMLIDSVLKAKSANFIRLEWLSEPIWAKLRQYLGQNHPMLDFTNGLVV